MTAWIGCSCFPDGRRKGWPHRQLLVILAAIMKLSTLRALPNTWKEQEKLLFQSPVWMYRFSLLFYSFLLLEFSTLEIQAASQAINIINS